jgi:Mannosyl-glycoprotein endo-beta-N-acetylglucosaminidase
VPIPSGDGVSRLRMMMTSSPAAPSSRSRRLPVAIAAAVVALVAAACVPQAAPIPGAVTIMGPSELTAAQIVNYLCNSPQLGSTHAYCTSVSAGGSWKPEITPLQMAQLYIDEGNLVDVRGDIAFCQSILETGWFRWTNSPWPEPVGAADNGIWPGYVLALDHNYAGLGAYNGSHVYMRTSTPQLGVRAQLQHLRNYADAASTVNNLGAPFEPRIGYGPSQFASFRYKGQAPTWVQLNGKWAVPGTTYAQGFLNICNNIRVFNGLAPLSTSSTGTSALSTRTADDGPIYAHETQQLQSGTTSRS